MGIRRQNRRIDPAEMPVGAAIDDVPAMRGMAKHENRRAGQSSSVTASLTDNCFKVVVDSAMMTGVKHRCRYLSCSGAAMT